MKSVAKIIADAGGVDNFIERMRKSSAPGGHMIESFEELLVKDWRTEEEKMLLSAVSLLSATEVYRYLALKQVYARIAAEADVDIKEKKAG